MAIEVANATLPHTGPARTNEAWFWYGVRAGPVIQGIVLPAASMAGFGWQAFGNNTRPSSRFVTTPQQRTMPVNSTIDNLTLPFLEIHSISWDKRSDFNEDISRQLNFSWEGGSSTLTLTGDRPFNHYHPGNAVLFDEHFLANYTPSTTPDNSTKATVPPPTVFRGIKKIALLAIRLGNGTDCMVGDSIFGNKTSMAKFKDRYYNGGFRGENCFLIGTVNLTAGIIRKRATYITPRVVEAEVGSSDSIMGDSWVNETLYLMPDVMTSVSMGNVSQIPTWDNVEGYVKDLVQISYQATWGQVAYEFNDSPLNLTAHEFAQRLQAVVSLPRVLIWYCAQFLVLISAVLLWVLQRKSKRPIAIDTGVVALLVDAAPVLNKHDATYELSGMSYVTGRDQITVQLDGPNIPDGGEQVRRRARSNSKSSEEAPLVELVEFSSEAVKPPPRFRLVPKDRGK